jgi:NADH:ubiquinone oxidoreductase subunit K
MARLPTTSVSAILLVLWLLGIFLNAENIIVILMSSS